MFINKILIFAILSISTTVIFSQEAFDEQFPNGIDASKWNSSDGYSNGSMFNCTWRASQVSLNDGILSLTLERDSISSSPPYKSGEFRSKGFYGYGAYEAKMKPVKNEGVVTSFFTYTGPSDKKPWDEIDIEFLGKDTTKVQLNWFKNGKGNHEHLVNLGFDASESFHEYGFEWRKGGIKFFVDGNQVYQAKSDIPENPGRIMINLWPGKGVDAWLKPFNGNTPLRADYSDIKFTP
jgi:beta-glucanase (GH16 family)